MCILHCLHLEISLSAQLSTAQEIIRTSARFHLFASHFSHGTNDERLLKLPSCVFLILPVQCTVRYLNFTLSHLNLSVPYPVFPTAMTSHILLCWALQHHSPCALPFRQIIYLIPKLNHANSVFISMSPLHTWIKVHGSRWSLGVSLQPPPPWQSSTSWCKLCNLVSCPFPAQPNETLCSSVLLCVFLFLTGSWSCLPP